MRVTSTFVAMLCLFLLSGLAFGGDKVFFDALALRESSNRPLGYRRDVNGTIVCGYFQISYAYWKDAYSFDPSIGGSWDRCRYDRGYAEVVVRAYMRRYCPKAYDSRNYEILARCHNSGPMYDRRGKLIPWKIDATDDYWTSVRLKMLRLAAKG